MDNADAGQGGRPVRVLCENSRPNGKTQDHSDPGHAQHPPSGHGPRGVIAQLWQECAVTSLQLNLHQTLQISNSRSPSHCAEPFEGLSSAKPAKSSSVVRIPEPVWAGRVALDSPKPRSYMFTMP